MILLEVVSSDRKQGVRSAFCQLLIVAQLSNNGQEQIKIKKLLWRYMLHGMAAGERLILTKLLLSLIIENITVEFSLPIMKFPHQYSGLEKKVC